MIDYFNFGLTLLAAICLAVTAYYLIKYKKKEDERLSKGFNALISSMVLLEIYLLIKVFVTFVNLFSWDLSNIISYLNLITDLAVVPLVIICILIAVILFKEV